jgi:outer membrane protein assembly factor BamD
MRKIKDFMLGFMCLLALSGCSAMGSVEDDIAKSDAKALFVHGDMALSLKNYAQATQYYEALDDKYPFSPYMEQAQVNLVYAYYAMQMYDNALAVADSYLSVYSRGKHADYTYYMRGLVYFDRDSGWLRKKFNREPALHDLVNLRSAYDNFSQVLQLFPKSRYALESSRRMVYIRNQMAESELLAAKYYYTKHAYMAAGNRLNYILTNFPGAPQQQQVLSMLRDVYEHLSMPLDKQKISTILQAQNG